MASQLSPAWQRKAVSSDHLAKISARFLSDGPQAKPQADGCQVIPFLLDNAAQHWVTAELCEVLNKRGCRSRVYAPTDATSDNADAALETLLDSQPGEQTLCLLPTTDPTLISRYRLSHVVLLVPANLDAVLNAYQRIKHLSRHNTPEIGIVMEGPRDQHAAWRYFRKLAVGTLRYLDVPLLNLGFLPEEVMPAQGPSDHHRENFLARISERLTRSGFHAICSRDNTPTQE